MARAGFDVVAVDRNVDALNRLQEIWAQSKATAPAAGSITTMRLELEGETWPLPVGDFGQWDLILVANYLYRPYLAQLPPMLSRGGRLIYETFAAGNAAFGRPSSPDFLLLPDELREFACRHELDVLDFAQGYVAHPRPAMTQRICALKP
jgi:hypothetical protein